MVHFDIFWLILLHFLAKKRPRKGATPSLTMPLPPPPTVPGLTHPSIQAPVPASKEEGGAEMAALYEQLLIRIKTLSRIPLTEPEARVNFESLSEGKSCYIAFKFLLDCYVFILVKTFVCFRQKVVRYFWVR